MFRKALLAVAAGAALLTAAFAPTAASAHYYGYGYGYYKPYYGYNYYKPHYGYRYHKPYYRSYRYY